WLGLSCFFPGWGVGMTLEGYIDNVCATIFNDERGEEWNPVSRCSQVSQAASALVRHAPAQTPVARPDRSVSHPGFGNHAAADPGGCSRRPLQEISSSISHGSRAGPRS